jgi:hypothetical protein
MKVTDEQLLDAIWRRMVINTATGAVSTYIGGRYGLAGDSLRHHGQDCHITSRAALGLPLSHGHLRKRIIALIGAGRLKWLTHDCTYWIECERSLEVWNRATAWWAGKGVPGGWDKENQRMRTTPLNDFRGLADELVRTLLEEFGERVEEQQEAA